MSRNATITVGLLVLACVLLWLVSRPSPEPSSSDAASSDAQAALALRRGHAREQGEAPRFVRPAKSSISGTIRTRGRGPLAGAQVCATILPMSSRGYEAPAFRPACTRSDAAGRYRLAELWPMQMVVSASAAQHEPGFWSTLDRGRRVTHVSLRAGRDVEGIDVELAPGGLRVGGVVRDIGGGEIEGAWVQTSTGIGTLSDEDGRFELWLARGRTTVGASAEGYATHAVMVVAPQREVELLLMPESVLQGRVVHAITGEPIADAEVTLHVGVTPVRSDADGRFRIDRLRPGSYEVKALAEGLAGESAATVTLGLAQTSEPIEILMHPSPTLIARVVLEGSDEPCVSGRVSLAALDKSLRVGALLDSEGVALVRGALPGEYRVEVVCEGYLGPSEPITLALAGDEQVEQTWAVRPGQAIRGRLVDAKGEPVPELQVFARVELEPGQPEPARTGGSASSDASGRFEVHGLVPGRYRLGVSGMPEPNLSVTLPEGRDLDDVLVQLPATGRVRGRVLDEQGTPLGQVEVRGRSLDGEVWFSSAWTDDAGEFVLEQLSPGRVRVFAAETAEGRELLTAERSEDEAPGEVVEVELERDVEVELRVVRQQGVIRGRVLDEDGRPVDDAVVDAARMGGGAVASRESARRMLGHEGRSVVTDADGYFEVSGLVPGAHILRAQRRGGGEAELEGVEVGESVELRITAPALLAGVIVVPGGELPLRFDVAARDSAAGNHRMDTFVRTQGRWQLGPLPAGHYEIVAESSAGTTTLELELEPGERRSDLELVLQPRVTVRGRLVDLDSGQPIAGVRVGIAARGARSSTPLPDPEGRDVSDADGRFEVTQAPTGLVNVRVQPGSDSRYERATLPHELASAPNVQDIGELRLVASRVGEGEQAGELGFELAPISRATPAEQVELRVALVRPGGPAARAGLAVGDVIVGLDGKSLVGRDHVRFEPLSRVVAGTTIELELADGRKLALTSEPHQ